MPVPPPDRPLVNCLKALHLALGDAFSNILDLEFENDMHIVKETLMGTM